MLLILTKILTKINNFIWSIASMSSYSVQRSIHSLVLLDFLWLNCPLVLHHLLGLRKLHSFIQLFCNSIDDTLTLKYCEKSKWLWNVGNRVSQSQGAYCLNSGVTVNILNSRCVTDTAPPGANTPSVREPTHSERGSRSWSSAPPRCWADFIPGGWMARTGEKLGGQVHGRNAGQEVFSRAVYNQ